jgi:hypothetical protein
MKGEVCGCVRDFMLPRRPPHQSFSRKWEVPNAQAESICDRVRDGTAGWSKRDFADAGRREFGTHNDFYVCLRRLVEGENRIILPAQAVGSGGRGARGEPDRRRLTDRGRDAAGCELGLEGSPL